MSIELVMPSKHLILCHLLLLTSVFPSFRIFSSESVLCLRWSKYWSFSFSIRPSNEYSGLTYFRIDWFDLLVQGTLKSLLQHQSSKASIFQCSAFFMSNSHIHTWLLEKPYLWLYGLVLANNVSTFFFFLSLLFNMLSRLVIVFLPRSKCLLILWLQLPSAVILKPKKIKSVTDSTISPWSDFPWSDGTGCHDLYFMNVEF